MPSKKAELGIELSVQTSNASKKISKFSKKGKRSFDSMGKSAKQFSTLFKGAIALFAGKQIFDAFAGATQAAAG